MVKNYPQLEALYNLKRFHQIKQIIFTSASISVENSSGRFKNSPEFSDQLIDGVDNFSVAQTRNFLHLAGSKTWLGLGSRIRLDTGCRTCRARPDAGSRLGFPVFFGLMGLHDGVGDREDRDEAEHADPRAEAHADQARLKKNQNKVKSLF